MGQLIMHNAKIHNRKTKESAMENGADSELIIKVRYLAERVYKTRPPEPQVIIYKLRPKSQMRTVKTSTLLKPLPQMEEEIFTVDPSFNSETVIKIIRTERKKHRNPPQSENPYVFKPKSYSKASRSRSNSINVDEMTKPPTKKPKLTITLQKPPTKPPCGLLTLPPISNYFHSSFFTQPSSHCSLPSTYPLLGAYPVNLPSLRWDHQLNTTTLQQIEIVSNQNQKQQVWIHKALIQANNPEKVQPGRLPLEGVVNPFAMEMRDAFMRRFTFLQDYHSGYAPIDLQEKNQAEPALISGANSGKNHYIKKKQSTLTLPRTCGVSYIKPSQSSQPLPYTPLPPLIFQCSSGCVSQPSDSTLLSLFSSYLSNSWLLFSETNQQNMRELLLGKNIGRLQFTKGIQGLWPLLTEGVFVLISFVRDFVFERESIWEGFHAAEVKIGILVKRSTSGKKMFFRSIGFDLTEQQQQGTTSLASSQNITPEIDELDLTDKDLQGVVKTAKDRYGDECAMFLRELSGGRTVTTLSLRMEMYVKQEVWPGYSKAVKSALNSLILGTKAKLESESLELIRKRFHLARAADKDSLLRQELKNLRIPLIYQDPSITTKPPYRTLDFTTQPIRQCLQLLLSEQPARQSLIESHTRQFPLADLQQSHPQYWSQKSPTLKMPYYYITTRDSFAFDLITHDTFIKSGDRCFTKTEYYFDLENLPANYGEFRKLFPNLEVGVVTYNGFFTEEELRGFQGRTFETEKKAFLNSFLQMTVQPTISGTKIRRTKFFFGYRYMWTRCQLAEPNSYVGAGVRKDVTPPPCWTNTIIDPLVQHGIIPKDFVNSIAINVYHDGKEGLAQHFDDAVRFKQPIYTLRLFSDARLSFGSQLYGFCNGAFIIPLPRGCICVMKQNSYAANGVKHCVRPCDMTGKSAAVILRQMHNIVTTEVDKYDEFVDFPLWMSTMSAERNAVSYAEQKRREAEWLLGNGKRATMAVGMY